MPWGLTRFQRSGQSHFVTFCCYHRLLLLTTDESRRIFESGLERVRCSFRLSVYGYVVMPEHLRSLRSRGRTNASAPTPGLFGLALPDFYLAAHQVVAFARGCV